jgi:hypothetical protein
VRRSLRRGGNRCARAAGGFGVAVADGGGWHWADAAAGARGVGHASVCRLSDEPRQPAAAAVSAPVAVRALRQQQHALPDLWGAYPGPCAITLGFCFIEGNAMG